MKDQLMMEAIRRLARPFGREADLRQGGAGAGRCRHRPPGHRRVYLPERERGNYVPTVISKRYDAFIYLDETKALSPLAAEPAGV